MRVMLTPVYAADRSRKQTVKGQRDKQQRSGNVLNKLRGPSSLWILLTDLYASWPIYKVISIYIIGRIDKFLKRLILQYVSFEMLIFGQDKFIKFIINYM